MHMVVVKIVLGIMLWIFICLMFWALIRGGTMNDNEEGLSHEQDRVTKASFMVRWAVAQKTALFLKL